MELSEDSIFLKSSQVAAQALPMACPCSTRSTAEYEFAPGEAPLEFPASDQEHNLQNLNTSSRNMELSSRNTVFVPEQGECPDMKMAWIWCDRCEFVSSLTCGQGSIEKELFKYFCIFPGAVSWAVCTPMDVVKSRLQADGVYLNQYKGILDCVLQSYQNEGLKVSDIWS